MPKPKKLKLPKKLSEKLQSLLIMGVGRMGSYDPEQVLSYIEETMTMPEVELVTPFLKWVHDNEKTFGRGNLGRVWTEYLDSLIRPYKITMEQIHSYGARSHGGRWLTANLTATHAAVRLGVDESTPENKLLISLVTLHIMETFFNPKSVHCVVREIDFENQKTITEEHGTKSIAG